MMMEINCRELQLAMSENFVYGLDLLDPKYSKKGASASNTTASSSTTTTAPSKK
jgi:hypothetical protein